MDVFLTGASGWIGSAVVPELIAAGHRVTGLVRSDASANALKRAGAEALHGTLDDLETVRAGAAASGGVIHLAFKHESAFSGDFQGAADADRRVVETIGEALQRSDRPLVIASGLLGISPGNVITESDDVSTPLPPGLATRHRTATITLDLASRGVRSSVVRLPPTVHGDGDHGFMAALIAVAREKGRSGYVDDGANRWPAAHRADIARLFRLVLEDAPAGVVVHANAEEGVPFRAVAEVIGKHLEIPVVSIARADASEHFGFLGGFVGLDNPASSAVTRERFGWQPTHPGLIADLDEGHYFTKSPTVASTS